MFVGLEKTTLVNFPGKVASAIFLPGCNMRCGFCHNAELALASSDESLSLKNAQNIYYSIEDVFSFLKKRKKILSGVVLTGGEPFASPHLFPIIREIKEMGFALKIDTNGLFPKRLQEVLHDEKLLPEMIAIDIKTSPSRYIELMPESVKDGEAVAQKIRESLELLASFERQNKGFSVDYRTVLVPNLVGESEIKEIAHLISRDASWHMAEFVSGACLNPEWNHILPYTKEEVEHLVKIAQFYIPKASLR